MRDIITIREIIEGMDGAGLTVTGDDDDLGSGALEFLDMSLETELVPKSRVEYLCNVALADIGEAILLAYDLGLESPMREFEAHDIPHVKQTIWELAEYAGPDYKHLRKRGKHA